MITLIDKTFFSQFYAYYQIGIVLHKLMFIMKKLQICLNQSINFHYFSNIIKKYFTEDFWIDKITLYDLILK